MLTTQAIVIREVDYRDHDKMLTLFSPTMGKIDALSRGSKKPNAKLLAASQLFTCGDYAFTTSKNKHYLSGCEITHTFFDLRKDYNKLFLAQFFVEVVNHNTVHNQPDDALYHALINCLFALEKDLNHADTITLFFVLKAIDALGLRPNLSHCSHCGTQDHSPYFSAAAGGMVCNACKVKQDGKKHRLQPAELTILNTFLDTTSKNIRTTIDYIAPKRLIEMFLDYLEHNLGIRYKGYRTIKTLNQV